MVDEKPTGSNSEGDGAEAPTGRKLGAKAIIEALKDDACEMIDQVAPTIIAGVENTEGAERAQIAITASYNPGGERSKARFDVSGKATIPAVGATHEMVIHETRDGAKQLKMFQPSAP